MSKIITRPNGEDLCHETLDEDGGRVGLIDLKVAVDDANVHIHVVALTAQFLVARERVLVSSVF